MEHGIIADSKSGVSGAGKAATAKTHFMHAADNLSAYAVFGHRHTGEILEQLGLSTEQVQFTPHLLPIPRGILSTIYVRLKSAMKPGEVEAVLRSFYATSPLVRIHATPQPAADPARGANELLRHRLRAGEGRQASCPRLLSRQLIEGRRRPGGAEHESDVRI